MTFILATGAKVYGANSYIAPGMVTEYLGTNSGQGSPGGLPASSIDDLWRKPTATLTQPEREKLEEYCRLATIFFDDKWGGQFNGAKQFEFEGAQATAFVGFTGSDFVGTPIGSLNIGNFNYPFGTGSTAGVGGYEILLGLIRQINEKQTEEIVASEEGVGIRLRIRVLSESGNFMHLSGTGAMIVFFPFAGGQHAGSQVLEFPRTGLYDSSGRLLTGVPKLVRNLCAEYALRIEAGDLSVPQTPVKDVLVTEETSKVGPISTTRKYAEPTVSPLSVIQRSEFYEFPIHQLLKTSLSGISGGTVFR